MIKFRIHSKIKERERCKFEKVLEKCQNYRFFDNFWGILDKVKGNLDKKCVKGKIGTYRTICKNDSFSCFDPISPPVPP